MESLRESRRRECMGAPGPYECQPRAVQLVWDRTRQVRESSHLYLWVEGCYLCEMPDGSRTEFHLGPEGWVVEERPAPPPFKPIQDKEADR